MYSASTGFYNRMVGVVKHANKRVTSSSDSFLVWSIALYLFFTQILIRLGKTAYNRNNGYKGLNLYIEVSVMNNPPDCFNIYKLGKIEDYQIGG